MRKYEIKIVPNVPDREDDKSVVAVRVVGGAKLNSNTEFQKVKISVEVFVPFSTWIFKNTNLRPFAILGEIQKSLEGKRINGLGEIQGGDFDLDFLTKEMSAYEQVFWITSYE